MLLLLHAGLASRETELQPRADPAALGEAVLQEEEHAGLKKILEANNYSSRLYGSRGGLSSTTSGLNMTTLRVVYMGLLDSDSVGALKHRVVSASCQGGGAHTSTDWCWADHFGRRKLSRGWEPIRPGGLWTDHKSANLFRQAEKASRSRTNLFKLNRVPRESVAVTNNAWVEVTHCATPHEEAKRGIAVSGAWFYVAPGAGVSLHVGKTLALQEADLVDAGIPIDAASDMLATFWTDVENPLTRFVGLTYAQRSAIDSVQRLDHREHSCLVPRDELILNPKYLTEEETMVEARGGVIKCGVHDPSGAHLEACNEEAGATAAALSVANCSWYSDAGAAADLDPYAARALERDALRPIPHPGGPA